MAHLLFLAFKIRTFNKYISICFNCFKNDYGEKSRILQVKWVYIHNCVYVASQFGLVMKAFEGHVTTPVHENTQIFQTRGTLIII